MVSGTILEGGKGVGDIMNERENEGEWKKGIGEADAGPRLLSDEETGGLLKDLKKRLRKTNSKLDWKDNRAGYIGMYIFLGLIFLLMGYSFYLDMNADHNEEGEGGAGGNGTVDNGSDDETLDEFDLAFLMMLFFMFLFLIGFMYFMADLTTVTGIGMTANANKEMLLLSPISIPGIVSLNMRTILRRILIMNTILFLLIIGLIFRDISHVTKLMVFCFFNANMGILLTLLKSHSRNCERFRLVAQKNNDSNGPKRDFKSWSRLAVGCYPFLLWIVVFYPMVTVMGLILIIGLDLFAYRFYKTTIYPQSSQYWHDDILIRWASMDDQRTEEETKISGNEQANTFADTDDPADGQGTMSERRETREVSSEEAPREKASENVIVDGLIMTDGESTGTKGEWYRSSDSVASKYDVGKPTILEKDKPEAKETDTSTQESDDHPLDESTVGIDALYDLSRAMWDRKTIGGIISVFVGFFAIFMPVVFLLLLREWIMAVVYYIIAKIILRTFNRHFSEVPFITITFSNFESLHILPFDGGTLIRRSFLSFCKGLSATIGFMAFAVVLATYSDGVVMMKALYLLFLFALFTSIYLAFGLFTVVWSRQKPKQVVSQSPFGMNSIFYICSMFYVIVPIFGILLISAAMNDSYLQSTLVMISCALPMIAIIKHFLDQATKLYDTISI